MRWHHMWVPLDVLPAAVDLAKALAVERVRAPTLRRSVSGLEPTAARCLTAGACRLLRRRRRGDIGTAVGLMIAGIALLDAMFLACAGRPDAAALALACFAATLLLQRRIRGT